MKGLVEKHAEFICCRSQMRKKTRLHLQHRHAGGIAAEVDHERHPARRLRGLEITRPTGVAGAPIPSFGEIAGVGEAVAGVGLPCKPTSVALTVSMAV